MRRTPLTLTPVCVSSIPRSEMVTEPSTLLPLWFTLTPASCPRASLSESLIRRTAELSLTSWLDADALLRAWTWPISLSPVATSDTRTVTRRPSGTSTSVRVAA